MLFMNRHEAYNNYDSQTNSTILSRRLCVSMLALYISFSSFFVNAATTNTVNACEWFESFIIIISMLQNLWIWMNRHMNQTYFDCTTCTYKSLLNWERNNTAEILLLGFSLSWSRETASWREILPVFASLTWSFHRLKFFAG